jgi:iron only hydrogenase large subunit-like protein
MQAQFPVYNQRGYCRDCYKCIRQCPVKAIRAENGKTDVVFRMCIACGRCVLSCPKFYKKPRKDIDKVELLLAQKKKVYVSLDMSFAAEFAECSAGQLIAGLKRLRFSDVSETALGAELVAAESARVIRETLKTDGENSLFISSACPSVVKYIKQYKKIFAPHVMDIASPLLVHARLLRKLYGDDIGIVSISPCIAKKLEADAFDEIDVAITYSELRQWFMYEGIILQNIESAGDDFVPYRASGIDSVPSGTDVTVLRSSGLFNIDELLSRFDTDTLTESIFLLLSACTDGCINGPGMCETGSGVIRKLKMIEYSESAKKETARNNTTLSEIEMTGALRFAGIQKKEHTKEEMTGALASIGKYKKSDEINCGSCGYNTCRDFCDAMLEKHAEKAMCVSYMRNLAQRQANGLLRAIPSGVVIVDKELNIIECNRNFARMMGPDVEEMYEAMPGLEGAKLDRITGASRYFAKILQSPDPRHEEHEIRERKKIMHLTVFLIEKNQIVAGVIEDITMPQSQKDRTLDHAKKIIDKNVSVVQQIAFLLGEHAAETEAILESLVQSYSRDDEE